MAFLPGLQSVLDVSTGYSGVNSSINNGRRNVSMVSTLGTGDGNQILRLNDIGWASKVQLWVKSGTVIPQISVTGLDTDWTTGGFYWRRSSDSSSNRYPLIAPTAISSPHTYFIDGKGPSVPFIRFIQTGSTAAQVHVSLQG